MKLLQSVAKHNQLTVIPLVQTFGHFEVLLNRFEFFSNDDDLVFLKTSHAIFSHFSHHIPVIYRNVGLHSGNLPLASSFPLLIFDIHTHPKKS